MGQIARRQHPLLVAAFADRGCRRRPQREEFLADLVLKAVGQVFVGEGPALQAGRIKVDNYQTSLPGVFAGGDCTAGMDLTVHAVQDGKMAARAIHEFLGS